MDQDTASESVLDNALRLAALGIPVFPVIADAKLPAVEEFPQVASTDLEKVRLFFTDPILDLVRPANIGLAMGNGLLGVDIDVKENRGGDDSVLQLESEGFLFPETFTQRTPTGSTHLVYTVPKDTAGRIRNSVQRLAPGIDIRSAGGYLVGAGSTVPEGSYVANWATPVPAPEWLLAKLARIATPPKRSAPPTTGTVTVNAELAAKRGKEEAAAFPAAEKGTRDSRAYELACKLKNLGVTEEDAVALIDECWAPRCDPPFPSDELRTPIANAYRYAKDSAPILAPEYEFEELPVEEAKGNPIEEMNKRYALVISGGSHHIIFETTDASGRPRVDHLAELSFHRKLAAKTMRVGEKQQAISRLWMSSPLRRAYDGFCFLPGKSAGPRHYNLFRGFTVEPTHTPRNIQASDALAMFLEHCLENVCQGDVALNEWLIGYFAHLFQRPWELPGVALVFRGKKGVGKNALIEQIGAMLGMHFVLTADKRYLSGNFNAHLESLLMLVLDEAFWSGQKDIEGTLKHLITGTRHLIERKGQEAYTIESCLRTVIIGNESWLVPATADERRYAVFDLGTGRMQDEAFFEKMRLGLEAGGYSLLLQYLLDYDLNRVNVRKAPNTRGLLDQKLLSAHPMDRWWYDCLLDESILGSTFIDEWPINISRAELRDAYRTYRRQNRMGGGYETDAQVGVLFGQYLPPLKTVLPRVDSGKRARKYVLPSLAECRQLFEDRMKFKIIWEE